MKNFILVLIAIYSFSAMASPCPSYIISGVELTEQEKNAIQLKGLTGNIFDTAPGKGNYSEINYSKGDKFLYFDVVDSNNPEDEKRSIVGNHEVTVSDSVEIYGKQKPTELLPMEYATLTKTTSYGFDARKMLTEEILGLPTCSF